MNDDRERRVAGRAAAGPPASDTQATRSGVGRAGLRQWLTLAANVGALLGLLLVVLQLRQNRELMRAEIRHELAMGIVDLLSTPAANSQLASVLRRGAAGETLTPDEEFQFRLRSNALLRYWEDVHYQYRQGLYDETEFSRQKEAWAEAMAGSVGFVRYWCEVRSLYSPLFAAEPDALAAPGSCAGG